MSTLPVYTPAMFHSLPKRNRLSGQMSVQSMCSFESQTVDTEYPYDTSKIQMRTGNISPDSKSTQDGRQKDLIVDSDQSAEITGMGRFNRYEKDLVIPGGDDDDDPYPFAKYTFNKRKSHSDSSAEGSRRNSSTVSSSQAVNDADYLNISSMESLSVFEASSVLSGSDSVSAYDNTTLPEQMCIDLGFSGGDKFLPSRFALDWYNKHRQAKILQEQRRMRIENLHRSLSYDDLRYETSNEHEYREDISRQSNLLHSRTSSQDALSSISSNLDSARGSISLSSTDVSFENSAKVRPKFSSKFAMNPRISGRNVSKKKQQMSPSGLMTLNEEENSRLKRTLRSRKGKNSSRNVYGKHDNKLQSMCSSLSSINMSSDEPKELKIINVHSEKSATEDYRLQKQKFEHQLLKPQSRYPSCEIDDSNEFTEMKNDNETHKAFTGPSIRSPLFNSAFVSIVLDKTSDTEVGEVHNIIESDNLLHCGSYQPGHLSVSRISSNSQMSSAASPITVLDLKEQQELNGAASDNAYYSSKENFSHSESYESARYSFSPIEKPNHYENDSHTNNDCGHSKLKSSIDVCLQADLEEIEPIIWLPNAGTDPNIYFVKDCGTQYEYEETDLCPFFNLLDDLSITEAPSFNANRECDKQENVPDQLSKHDVSAFNIDRDCDKSGRTVDELLKHDVSESNVDLLHRLLILPQQSSHGLISDIIPKDTCAKFKPRDSDMQTDNTCQYVLDYSFDCNDPACTEHTEDDAKKSMFDMSMQRIAEKTKRFHLFIDTEI